MSQRFPGRTIERGRGCWNCTAFENGAESRMKYQVFRNAEVARLTIQAAPALARIGDVTAKTNAAVEVARLMGIGLDLDTALLRVLGKGGFRKVEDARFAAFDRRVAAGQIGMCRKGHAPGDFVEAKYLCDHWNGAQGHSVATQGHALDKIPEELREILDGPAAKVIPIK